MDIINGYAAGKEEDKIQFPNAPQSAWGEKYNFIKFLDYCAMLTHQAQLQIYRKQNFVCKSRLVTQITNI